MRNYNRSYRRRANYSAKRRRNGFGIPDAAVVGLFLALGGGTIILGALAEIADTFTTL